MAATPRPLEPSSTRLPPEVTARLLADGPTIANRLARHLVEEIPLGAGYRNRRYLRAVVAASRDGVLTLLRRLHTGGRAQPAELAGLGVAGSRQAELGVPLEVLLSGYRLAAKVIWREVVDEATRLGHLSPGTVVALSDQVLEYLDDISAAVGRSYLETRDRLVRQRDRERDRVLQRLLAGDASMELLRMAATYDLDLSPPYRVLALRSGTADVEADKLAATLGERGLLVPEEPGSWIALVPAGVDASTVHRRARQHAPDLTVGAGPVAVTLEDIAGSARLARETLDVGARLDGDVPVHDHRAVAPFALLAADRTRANAFAEHVLGPLLTGSARDRALVATVDAVLRSRSLNQAATRLGVHRHTVVYRLDRIRRLLAVDLDDPADRHRLWLALQCLAISS